VLEVLPAMIYTDTSQQQPFRFSNCRAAHPVHELEVLEQVLGKLSVMHISKNVKKNAMPFNLAIPQIDPKTVRRGV
jgi:hypothetical protein